MKSSESIKELAEALSSAQAELKPAPFDKANEFAGYKYASLNSVIEVAKKVLPKYGLAVTQTVISEVKDGFYYAGVSTTLLHKSGEWISDSITVPVAPLERLIELSIATDQKGKQALGKSNLVQEIGKTLTYCRRYGYSSIIGISSDEDTDAAEDSGEDSHPETTTEVVNATKAEVKPMNLQEAMEVVDSKGVPYHQLAVSKLQYMSANISKAMKKEGISPEKLHEYKTKLEAIGVLLRANASGEIELPKE